MSALRDDRKLLGGPHRGDGAPDSSNLATAIASMRHAALPRWFGWLSLVLALILAFPLLGWLGVYLGLPLWVVTASVLLYRRSESTAARA